MKKEELETKKKFGKIVLEVSNLNRKKLEQNIQVAQYIQELKIIETEQNHLDFLQKLEVGEDGTVFAPYDPTKQKKYQGDAGLYKIFKHAFHLRFLYQKAFLQETTGEWNEDPYEWLSFFISYDEFDHYLKGAKKNLMRPHYIKGDPIASNPYQYEIYENPRNYSVIDEENIINRFSPWLLYGVNLGIKSNQEKIHGYKMAINRYEYPENDISKLTPREWDAFYGIEAQKSLGLKPIEEGKVYKK